MPQGAWSAPGQEPPRLAVGSARNTRTMRCTIAAGAARYRLSATRYVADMATKVSLYFGLEPDFEEFEFTDARAWEYVRSQIETAVQAGQGLIRIPRQRGERVYVYSPTLHVNWTDKSS